MNYIDLLWEIMQEGKQIKDTKELMHVNLIVPKGCLYSFPEVRPLHQTGKYMEEEVAWYMSGNRDHTEIAKHAELWRKIKNADGTLNSNYGNLVFYNRTQHPSLGDVCLPPFEWAARSLESNVDSRQGVVTYNNGGFNYVGNLDYICSQHQAFYIRNNTLLCYIALRSSDAIFGLTYNMPWWQLVYQQMFLRLQKTYPELKSASIQVTIYSAHIYERHFELVRRMLRSDNIETYEFFLGKELPLGQSYEWYKENLRWIKLTHPKSVTLTC